MISYEQVIFQPQTISIFDFLGYVQQTDRPNIEGLLHFNSSEDFENFVIGCILTFIALCYMKSIRLTSPNTAPVIAFQFYAYMFFAMGKNEKLEMIGGSGNIHVWVVQFVTLYALTCIQMVADLLVKIFPLLRAKPNANGDAKAEPGEKQNENEAQQGGTETQVQIRAEERRPRRRR